MNLYVGNLSRDVTEDDLRQAFAVHGEVSAAMLIKDKFTGESRGFGFVELASGEDVVKAIESLNGRDFGGRTVQVNEARPERPRSSGGGGDRGDRGQGGGRQRW